MCVIYNSKLSIWLDKARNLKTPLWALGNYNVNLSLFTGILLTKQLIDLLENDMSDYLK